VSVNRIMANSIQIRDIGAVSVDNREVPTFNIDSRVQDFHTNFDETITPWDLSNNV